MRKLLLFLVPVLFSACSNELDTSLSLSADVTLSRMGVVTELDSASTWYIKEKNKGEAFTISYEMLTGKRLHCENQGITMFYTLIDSMGHEQRLEMRTLVDGIAFRYTLGAGYEQPCALVGEQTTLSFRPGTNRWLMKWADSYEGFFPRNPEMKEGDHWGYPALFETPDASFALLTEANIERNHAASSFYSVDSLSFNIRPDKQDTPVQTGYTTPWRVLMMGSLSEVVNSTLVTDLSQPCALADTSWIEPGVVSWIYWANNHGSNNYDIVCQYVDMADSLHLPYVLIDAEWDEMPEHSAGHQTIEDALNYAHSKGVKPLIWYNSCIGWVNGAPGPKWRLNDPEKRETEFQWCEEHGVAGVKIDFFSGDNEANMNYCIDLLESAARHHLSVNFHGATIPRGWMRTYPNLLSTEAVYGAEWYNNLPVLTNRAACHNATLPFTRGVIGSMDYTPCTFTDSQHPHITTHAHELALTVLFESGLLHLADRPSAYLSQPQEIKDFLSELPAAWDETRLIDGYPGHHIVMARRKGTQWYIVGINGTDDELEVVLDDDDAMRGMFDKKSDDGTASFLLIEDGDPWQISRVGALPPTITLRPRGGFIVKV